MNKIIAAHKKFLKLGGRLSKTECYWLDIRNNKEQFRLGTEEFVKILQRRGYKYNPKTKNWIKK